MTEMAIATGGITIAAIGGAVACLAVIDPSITSIALAVIAGAAAIIPLWFKFRTDQMAARLKEHDAKIAEVIKTSDGMKTDLVRVTEEAERAKGVLDGVAQAESKAAIVTTAKAIGVAEAAAAAHKE